MPDIDNHMDDLFKKAAENYPLKINTGNFDELMPFIAGEANTATTPVLLKGKRKTALLLLVLLLTGASIGTYLITNTHNNKTVNNITGANNNTAASTQNNAAAQVNIEDDKVVAGNTSTENMVTTAENIFQKNRPAYNSKGKMFTNITQPNAVTDENAISGNEIFVTKEEPVNKTAVETENQQEYKSNKPDPAVKKENTDKPDKKNEPKKEETKPSPKKNKNKPGFYYGIAAGAELNKVKTQDMTKAGFNGGLVLGLQINKKIAVETGVQLSQKKYYSDGKYFKPKTGSMPSNMTVSSLQSTSTLIEIPVSVKYNFSKKKNTLYGKAGLSSYIMTKESNKYQAVVSGQQQEVNSTYKANKGYLASDVRISAGYQHTVNKKMNMRIEPYIQIPLKGIGVGSLPVTTTGLQIVLTRN
jgi:hypothetical protein